MNTIISAIATPLGYILTFIYNIVGHYGVALIFFTMVIRAIIFPLYAKQMKNSAKMSELQPKMQELQKKYSNDKETLNAKMMELYSKEKFNPMAGCLPMLIQLPILWGLFSLLRNPSVYIPNNTEMWIAAHDGFLWITDLSQPDPWILPILSGVCTYFSMLLTQQQQNMAGSSATQMAPMMNMMKYVIPVMIVWMGRSFPAGLALYWFISTVVQILQTVFFNSRKKKQKAQKAN